MNTAICLLLLRLINANHHNYVEILRFVVSLLCRIDGSLR